MGRLQALDVRLRLDERQNAGARLEHRGHDLVGAGGEPALFGPLDILPYLLQLRTQVLQVCLGLWARNPLLI